MSARSDRAARMGRASNRGNRVAAGFPIVDEQTLRLRLHEYGEARKRLEEAQRQLGLLQAHIVKRGLALADKGVPVLEIVPAEWLTDALAQRYVALWRGGLADEWLARSSVRQLLTDPTGEDE